MNIIDEITKEVDKTLAQKVDNPRLRELAVQILADDRGLPERLVEMASDIHEIDTDTEPDEKKARELNLLTFEEFLKRLEKIRQGYRNLWPTDGK